MLQWEICDRCQITVNDEVFLVSLKNDDVITSCLNEYFINTMTGQKSNWTEKSNL